VVAPNLESSAVRATTAHALAERTIRPKTSEEAAPRELGWEDLDSERVNWSSSESILAGKMSGERWLGGAGKA
jgi:hypothetical protein